MIKTFLTMFKVNAAMSCNRFLYWLKRIPLLGRLFDDGLYSDLGAKQTVLILVSIYKVLRAFVGKFIYLTILSLLLFIPYEQNLLDLGWPMFLWVFMWCSFMLGTMFQPDALQPSPLKYTCIRQLKMDARRFILTSAIEHHVGMAVTFTPALMVAALAYHQSPWAGLILSLELAACRLMGESLHLLLFQRTGKLLCKNVGYIIIIFIVGLGSAVVPLFAEVSPPMDMFLLHPVTAISFAALGILSLVFLIRFPLYCQLARELCKPEYVDLSLAKNKAKRNTFRDVELKDSDLTAENSSGKLSHLHGYAYLNALFFQRHRRMLTMPVKIELAIVGVLGVIGLIFTVLFREETASVINNMLPIFLPYSVFMIYLAANSIGTRICKAMFYNCDISLLRYGWYRQKDVVLKNFTIRLVRLTTLNLTVAGALCLVFILIAILSGSHPALGTFIPFLLCILCLAVMFSVHPLFMYYVFQPYTTSLDVKNPFFSILNFVVYLFSYACIQIRQPLSGFAAIVLAVTILYSGIALITVFFRAPKTFRVK